MASVHFLLEELCRFRLPTRGLASQFQVAANSRLISGCSHESKFPFVTRIEFIRSRLPNCSAHVCGLCVRAGQISYSADIVPGGLEWDETQLQFHVTDEDADRPRNISLANRFAVPLAIYNVSLSAVAAEYFKVRRTGSGQVTALGTRAGQYSSGTEQLCQIQLWPALPGVGGLSQTDRLHFVVHHLFACILYVFWIVYIS